MVGARTQILCYRSNGGQEWLEFSSAPWKARSLDSVAICDDKRSGPYGSAVLESPEAANVFQAAARQLTGRADVSTSKLPSFADASVNIRT